MAEDARRMPSRQAEYENLVLNRRIEVNNPFISRPVWAACGTPVVPDFKGLPVYGALDLVRGQRPYVRDLRRSRSWCVARQADVLAAR
jgi:hypothetical protein